MIKAQSRKGNIVSVLREECGYNDSHSFTWLYDSLPNSMRRFVNAAVLTASSELPIICGRFSDESWYVITTSRIIASHQGKRAEVNVEDISSVDWGPHPIGKRLNERNEQEFYEDNGVALIRSRHGKTITLECENGPPGLLVASALQYFLNWKLERNA